MRAANDSEYDGAQIMQAINDFDETGDRFVVSMPTHERDSMEDFDYSYRSVLATETEAVLRCDGDYRSAPDFIHVQYNGNVAEMYVLDIEHGSTFIGSIHSVRRSQRNQRR